MVVRVPEDWVAESVRRKEGVWTEGLGMAVALGRGECAVDVIWWVGLG